MEEETFEAEVRKWGNSLGVVIPHKTSSNLALQDGERVIITVEPVAEKYFLNLPKKAYATYAKEAQLLLKFKQFKHFKKQDIINFLVMRRLRINEVLRDKDKADAQSSAFLDFMNIWIAARNNTEANYHFKTLRSKALKQKVEALFGRFKGLKPSLEATPFSQTLITEFRKVKDVEEYSEVFLLKLLSYALMRNFSGQSLEEINSYAVAQYKVKDMFAFFNSYKDIILNWTYADLCKLFVKVAHQFPDYPSKPKKRW